MYRGGEQVNDERERLEIVNSHDALVQAGAP